MILVSVSGGKDSTATLLVAIERHGVENVRAAFADTGNEHPATYDYVRYLAGATGVAIHWLKPDFSEWWARRTEYARTKYADKGVHADVIEKILSILEKGPTGNPYLENKRGIRNIVEWSKTKRGGQLIDWIRVTEEPKACSSAYGLCE